MQSDNKDNIGSDDSYTKVLIVIKTIVKKWYQQSNQSDDPITNEVLMAKEMIMMIAFKVVLLGC